MRQAAVLTALCLAGVLISVAVSGTKTANAEKTVSTSAIQVPTKVKKEETCNKWKIVKGIRFYRASAWYWDWAAGTSPTRFSKWKPKHSCGFLTYLAVQSRKKAHIAKAQFQTWYARTYSKWACIHSYEGSWQDAGDPFWGGLQMDRGFMSSYGSDFIRAFHGYANVWPVWAQLRAAERAYYSGRGFYPWPNTARYCGLI